MRPSSDANPTLARAWEGVLRRATEPQYALAYGAQLVSFLTAVSFNLIVPLQVGPTIYGGFVAAFSLSFTVFAVFGPGFSLAVARNLMPAVTSSADNRVLLRWLMYPAFAAALGVAVLGGSAGLNVFGGSGVVRICAVALVPALSAMYLLDTILVAQSRNGLSLISRLAVGVGNGTLPWALSASWGSPASVMLGVLLSYVCGLIVPIRVLLSAGRDGPSKAKHPELRLGALYSSSVHYSAISVTSTLFSWATLLIVASKLAPEELAGLKIALAVPTAVVALLPFPQMFIFARLQAAAATRSSRRPPAGLWILGTAAGVGVVAAATLGLLGPAVVSAVYGRAFAPAAAYVGLLAWMVVPQAVEQPLLAVLSTVYRPQSLTPFYVVALVVSLTVPVAASAVYGWRAYAIGIVIGRFASVALPALLLCRRQSFVRRPTNE